MNDFPSDADRPQVRDAQCRSRNILRNLAQYSHTDLQ